VSGVLIAGIGMTPFGRFPGRGIRSMAVAAIDQALGDAGIAPADVKKILFGNAVAGIVSQQEMIRGQVALRNHALAGTTLVNVENACASGGSALNLAYELIAGGRAEVVLAVGVEQLNHADRSRPFNALRGSTDIDEIGESLPGTMASNSILMNFYAGVAQRYLDQYDATSEDFARVAVKNRRHAAMNPLAQFREPQTVADVMASRADIARVARSLAPSRRHWALVGNGMNAIAAAELRIKSIRSGWRCARRPPTARRRWCCARKNTAAA